jgi:ApaG protein
MSSEAVTRGIRVKVRTELDDELSAPAEGRWFYRYTISLRNEGEETVQLLTRHWIITDGEGRVEEVRGPGVVGYQPVLAPGQSFEYTSGCPLTTPFGVMQGTYQMVTADGEAFDAEIAPFELSEPHLVN